MELTPIGEKKPYDGLTRGQGNLLLFLLGANLFLQTVGRNGLFSAASKVEEEGESTAHALAMWGLAVGEWFGILIGSAAAFMILWMAVYIWWNHRRLGLLANAPD